jgi:hypothetical protein
MWIRFGPIKWELKSQSSFEKVNGHLKDSITLHVTYRQSQLEVPFRCEGSELPSRVDIQPSSILPLLRFCVHVGCGPVADKGGQFKRWFANHR